MSDILDRLDAAAELENAENAREELAKAVGGYYRALVDQRVPPLIAGQLVMDYQQFLFLVGSGGDSDD